MDLHCCIDNRVTDLVPLQITVLVHYLNFSVSSVVKLILSRTA